MKSVESMLSAGDKPHVRGSVLIVEPVQPLRQHLLDLVLEENDLESCGGVGSAQEAIHVLLEIKPDLVLIGASLTGRKGLQTVKDLRLADSHVKLLVLSAQLSPSYAMQMLTAGANGYATLEDLDQLTDVVQDVLSGALYVSECVTSYADQVPSMEIPSNSPIPPGTPADRLPLRSKQEARLCAIDAG